jgi:hypothetical protein
MGLILLLLFAFFAVSVLTYGFGWLVSKIIGVSLRGRYGSEKWQVIGKYAVILGFPLWGLILVYMSFNPNDDFYLQRFKITAMRDAPKSAKVIAKSAALVALHSGESCTYSRILLTQQDYLNLIEELASDPSFRLEYKRSVQSLAFEHDNLPDSLGKGEVSDIAGFITVNSSYKRLLKDEPSKRHYRVIFLTDQKHVEIDTCL